MSAQAGIALPSERFEVSTLTQPDELAAIELLYREVFTSDPTDSSINHRLLFAIAHHGGIVVGARAGTELIGFAFSFLARDAPGGEPYQYSQTAGVTQAWRGRGVGRALKLAQREAALASGIELMRWRYDPMQAANAHFNLDVLGGLGVRLERDAYGMYGPPADGGEPTDRLLVDWRLSSPRVRARAVGGGARPVLPDRIEVGQVVEEGGVALLGLPADWRSVRANPECAGVRAMVIGEMDRLLGDGYLATSCTRWSAETAVYRFERAEQILGADR